jgi:hypothetical protein
MSGEDQVRIGRAQARRVRERPAEAPLGRRLSNKDTLKLSKAAARNLLEGTMAINRKKIDEDLKSKRRSDK